MCVCVCVFPLYNFASEEMNLLATMLSSTERETVQRGQEQRASPIVALLFSESSVNCCLILMKRRSVTSAHTHFLCIFWASPPCPSSRLLQSSMLDMPSPKDILAGRSSNPLAPRITTSPLCCSSTCGSPQGRPSGWAHNMLEHHPFGLVVCTQLLHLV